MAQDTKPETQAASSAPRRPNLLDVALRIASTGERIFPCNPWNKQPLTPHGFKDATTDANQIRAWWSEHSNAIIGSPTGSITNRVVIDIDSDRAEEELQLLADQADATIPATYTVKTGRGKHLYFQYPAHHKIGCGDREMPGQINVRGDGGYVIIPPSMHPAGGCYEVVDPSPKAALPAWLLKLLTSVSGKTTLALREVTPRWAWQQYHRALAELRRAKPGTRNNVLNKTAWWAARLSDHPLLADQQQVMEQVVEIGLRTGLDEREVRSTVNSGWQSGLANKLTILPIHECTDLGNADRFMLRFGDRVRHVKAFGANGWLVWDGHRWNPDSKSVVRRFAHETIRAIYQEAAAVEDDDLRKRLVAWGVRSESASATVSMLEAAQPYAAVDPVELDADPELVNLENGTLDMRTGDMRDQRPTDLITRMIPVRYEPRASCPVFEKHLALVLPDKSVRDYFQEMIAYYLSGSTVEQCIHILLGGGENGKSTTEDLFRNMAGDYGCVAKRELFAADGYSGIPEHDLADLLGRRIATCSEFEEGDVLRVSLMKALTSGQSSKVRARRKYGHPFEFQPQVKFLLDSNYPLKVDSPDHGTWRRIRVIPFDERIPADRKDLYFADKLWAERSGVLNWVIIGLRRWNARGRVLDVPDAIKKASGAYEQESDLLRQFIDEQCTRAENEFTPLRSFTSAYRDWAKRVTTKGKSQIGERDMEKRLAAKRVTIEYDNKLRCKKVLGIRLHILGFGAIE